MPIRPRRSRPSSRVLRRAYRSDAGAAVARPTACRRCSLPQLPETPAPIEEPAAPGTAAEPPVEPVAEAAPPALEQAAGPSAAAEAVILEEPVESVGQPAQPESAPEVEQAAEPAEVAGPAVRIERDPLGELDVPATAYYGIQTARAIRNFPISGRRPDPALVLAAVQVKKAAARANHATGRLPELLAGAIIRAADEILGLTEDSATPEGRQRRAILLDNFRVDPFQAGAGVSHNMNTNEVLANRAIELLGQLGIGSGRRGDYAVVSPNDHVNMAQSTNDVFPTAMRVATLDRTRELLPVAR